MAHLHVHWCPPCRSRYQLEYSQAQGIMEGAQPKPAQEVAPGDLPRLQRNLRLLAALAEHRRQLRLEVGDRGCHRLGRATAGVYWRCRQGSSQLGWG